MMFDKRFILAAFVVVLSTALVGCGKTSEEASDSADTTNKPAQEVREEQKEEGGLFTMLDLFGMKKAQECVVKDQGAETHLYTDGERSLVEISGILDGNGGDTMYTLNDGTWTYTWTDGQSTGVKMNNATMESLNDDLDWEEDDFYEDDFGFEAIEEEAFPYTCTDWRVDENKFKAPSNVEFQDTSALLESMKNFQEDFAGSMRGICDLLEGSDKEECLASF